MRIKKILKILLVVIINLLLITPISFASDNFNLDIFEGGSAPASINDLTNNTLGTIISVIRVIGTGIALIIIMIIAVKYMMSAPGDRADIKRHAIPFVIGAFVLFGTSQILSIIVEFSKSISSISG